MKTLLLVLPFCLMLGCAPKGNSVRIALPLPPKLDLSLYDYIYFPGFITDTKNAQFDTDREAISFFRQELKRRDVMTLIDEHPVDMSDKDPRSFFQREQPFFKTFNFENSEHTLAVTGVVTFEILDRSGFREVTSTDRMGRRYYRTQFVEMTGFNLNMRVFVYELNEGKLLYRELLKDSLDVEGSDLDEKLVYYELLTRVSERVLGLFSNTVVKAERSLL